MTTEAQLVVTLDLTREYSSEEFDALLKLYTGDEKLELIDGRIVVTPPGGWEHALIATRIIKAIGIFDPDEQLGQVIQPARFKLENVQIQIGSKPKAFEPAPDVAFVVTERIPPGKHKEGLQIAPDLAVEVWSPSDLASAGAQEKALEKLRLYQQAGVRLIWSINPKEEKIEVYHLGSTDPVILGINDTLDGEDIIPGFRLPINKLFK